MDIRRIADAAQLPRLRIDLGKLLDALSFTISVMGALDVEPR